VPLAHAGHWLASLLYLAPVLLIVVALIWQARREKRRGYEPEEDEREPTLDDIMDGRA
jgi:cytochrome c-type biogenesis protein CcmH/NrfF